VQREAARLATDNEQVLLRPAVANNGLYDTWTLWNWSSDKSQTVSVALREGKNPAFAIDARDGKNFPVTISPRGTRLENVVLEPLENQSFSDTAQCHRTGTPHVV
jgi:VCBS repeat-containing protein